jgi:zinc transport system substrate-binding protein
MLVINGTGFEEGWITDINTKFLLDTSLGLNLTNDTDGYADEENVSSVNPHIWLDPIFAKQQVENIRDGLIKIGLIKIDHVNAAYYSENANRFIAAIDNLDRNYQIGTIKL